MGDPKIGKAIRARRLALGMTLVDLAGKVGRGASAVNAWELGLTLPSAHARLPLLAALGLSTWEELEKGGKDGR
jgi:transcriptional regulator with XRE-family HTH domain